MGFAIERRVLMGSIELSNIEKWFGDAQVIKGIDLKIKAGEFIIFVGPWLWQINITKDDRRFRRNLQR